MFTRNQYMAGEVSFQDYYSQFVTEPIKHGAESYGLVEKSRQSKDKWLNDVPLKLWDQFGERWVKTVVNKKLIAETGEGLAPSTLVCIGKVAVANIIGKQLGVENGCED